MNQTKDSTADKKPAATNTDSVLQRAMKGDASTLAELRKLLTQPAAVELLGNLARLTEQSMIDTAAGENLAFKEGMTRKMQTIREDLAGPNPTPLERLLVERIALCWLSLHDAEVRLAGFKNPTIAQGDYWQRKIDHSHRRYLTAIKTLATIRKLGITLQVNIAKQQTNIAGTVAAPQVEKETE